LPFSVTPAVIRLVPGTEPTLEGGLWQDNRIPRRLGLALSSVERPQDNSPEPVEGLP